MSFDIDDNIIYFTTVFFLLIFSLMFNKYINTIRRKNNKFIFNVKIIEGFENWLNFNLTLNMTKYIEEILGEELKPEEELNISPEFAQEGIDRVTATIISQMPIFYKDYMTAFYGEERLIIAIREKARYIFIKFIENTVKKRAGGGVALFNKNEEESPQEL